MRWEERLLEVFDDLELQAEGLHLAERAARVAELSPSEYAETVLSARLHASVGCQVALFLGGSGSVEGVLANAGRDWVLVRHEHAETLVRTATVVRLRGASGRSSPERTRSVTARLGLGSALRRLAAERERVAVTLTGGDVVRGRLLRIGADFAELASEAGPVELVPFDGVVMLRRLLP